MQTRLPITFLESAEGREADRIIRSCVHCGFCTATCPTFLLTGNELDSPRGRIYLIKEMLEKEDAGITTQTHLDRCLSCQGCETTCPSNVQYHSLLNIGRAYLEQRVSRSFGTGIRRSLILMVLGSKRLFGFLVALGKLTRAFLPGSLARQLPGKTSYPVTEAGNMERRVVLLDGCVQPSLSPATNEAARLVLSRLGVGVIRVEQESCCGALHYHSNRQEKGLRNARKLVDQVSEALASGAEAVISTTSGCGNFIKDYPAVFTGDDVYRERSLAILAKVQDISEFLREENFEALGLPGGDRLVFHTPCTLSHGQGLAEQAEELLEALGFDLSPVANGHLCCGSAGTYSLLQPGMASRLRQEKVRALEAGDARIATANIGCQCHIAGGTNRPVKHWIEYVAEALAL